MKNLAYKIAIAVLTLIIIILASIIIVTWPKRPEVPKITAMKGRIAIVIDDWGYTLNNLPIVDEIKYPITASILPNLDFSRQVAEEFHNKGFEVILHLPSQPHERIGLEKNTILTSMNEKTVSKIVEEGIASVPYLDGVSNHMGSAATEDARTMESIFKELKKKNLFFLDSYVTAKSICSKVARKVGIRFAKRDVFLDNVEDLVFIKQEILKLKLRAKAKGYAIGIGHDRKMTLQVLKEVMPQLEKEGFKFVSVSELVK